MKKLLLCVIVGACCVLTSGCQDDYTVPDLVNTMNNLSKTLMSKESCDAKFQAVRSFLNDNETKIQRELHDFNRDCPNYSSIRCQSYRMLMGSRIELRLRTCINEDVNHEIPELYHLLSDAFGVYFDSVE